MDVSAAIVVASVLSGVVSVVTVIVSGVAVVVTCCCTGVDDTSAAAVLESGVAAVEVWMSCVEVAASVELATELDSVSKDIQDNEAKAEQEFHGFLRHMKSDVFCGELHSDHLTVLRLTRKQICCVDCGGSRILVRGAQQSFDPKKALNPKFAQNRGFRLKID